MNPDDRVRLRHMTDALETAIRFTTGRSRADLDRNEMLLLALVQAIQIAGEAASKLSRQFRSHHPEIPWESIIGMRNRLVHAYFDMNRDIVWRTATEAIPAVLDQIRDIVGLA